MVVEPPPCRWVLPDPLAADEDGIVGIGADLAPGTLVAAYRRGLFPMHLDADARVLGWWSPDPRGVLPLDRLHVSRTLARSCRRFTTTVDTDFAGVIDACAAPRQGGGHWINPALRAAYVALHELGWAHSVEVHDDAGTLVGGLYGVAVGGLFAGESMFHRATDASKVAVVGVVERLRDDGRDGRDRLFDVQWCTPHLATLGVVEVPAAEYQRRLTVARDLVLPPAFR